MSQPTGRATSLTTPETVRFLIEASADIEGRFAGGRMDRPPMTFFTLGNHHDFAIVAVGSGGADAPPKSPGLFHVAFKVGDTTDDLRETKAHLEALGVEITGISDHTVSESIYLNDPDGNGIELYVDASDVWRTDPQAVASIAPLTL